jgi:hypothetical protein
MEPVIMIDFSPVKNGQMTMLEFSKALTVADLQRATNESINFMLALIADLADADLTFDPVDPEANDQYAVAGEEHIGWSLAHLIVHVTASAEENAAYGSILARGVPYPAEPRLRYETHWRSVTTKAQCIQRLEESRRMRLGYLAVFPDHPFLDIKRQMSEKYLERNGEVNAFVAFLNGLRHESGHYDQMKEVKRQALAARVARA